VVYFGVRFQPRVFVAGCDRTFEESLNSTNVTVEAALRGRSAREIICQFPYVELRPPPYCANCGIRPRAVLSERHTAAAAFTE
jgi:hypothetical protein